jgi:protease I
MLRKSWMFVLAFALLGCSRGGEGEKVRGPQNLPDMSGRKVLIVVPHQDYRDEEFLKPDKVFKKVGMTVSVASSEESEALGMNGHKVKPDLLVSAAKAGDYDAVILIGGSGANAYWEDTAVLSLVREASKLGKVVGATSTAVVTLGRAGVLSGKRAAVTPETSSEVTKTGATASESNVETDGNVVTANGPEDSRPFSEAVIRVLAGG